MANNAADVIKSVASQASAEDEKKNEETVQLVIFELDNEGRFGYPNFPYVLIGLDYHLIFQQPFLIEIFQNRESCALKLG